MMTLLDTHLEQISLSSAAIAELPFPRPKIFTNALLHRHDITTLIRDTESHERALFSVAPPDLGSFDHTSNGVRRSTVFNLNGNGEASVNGASHIPGLKRTNAVSMLLGGDVVDRMHRGLSGEGRERGEMDVEALLKGAERLCGVYPIPGASGKIASLRARHSQLSSSIAHYESRVSKQATQLDRMNHPEEYEAEGDDGEEEVHIKGSEVIEDSAVTVNDLQREEEEIRELEKKKRGLEDRVSGMERDLGGLWR
ncbi:DASH complex subunit Spc34 [Lasallia pustulata]|uniref:DASH complex subunit SPC34 n=1 Tax=Lasallia pustulata TaxID=136370 RepID=A0A1W5D248_9LECA|nr:DASH complex subunit Spc34 [Lasallia pustulata]